jgi:hypothetical protein
MAALSRFTNADMHPDCARRHDLMIIKLEHIKLLC